MGLVETQLQKCYNEIEDRAKKAHEEVRVLADRRSQAQVIMDNYKDISSVVFAMLDDKEYKSIIWKQLKPKHEQPFKNENN